MPIVSPRDLAAPGEGGRLERLGDVDLLWSFQEDFGPHLEELRKTRGVSLRRLAEQVGVSHSYLVRLQAGDKAKAPPTELVESLADVLRTDPRDLLHRAGFRFDIPEKFMVDATDAQFSALVLAPELRPLLMNIEALPFLSGLVKRQWIEFARKLAAQPDPAALVERLLARGAGGDRP